MPRPVAQPSTEIGLYRQTPDISLYRQVDAILRDQIADGALRPGDRLPSEDELRGRFGISRGTLRQALDSLERDGLIARTPGRGTFVREAPATKRGRGQERSASPLEAMIADAARADRLVRQGLASPPAVVARALGVDPGAELPFFIRLSGPRGTPIGLKRYLHPRLVAQADALAQAADFPAVLAGQGKGGKRKTAHIGPAWAEAILAEPRFAMQLRVPVGSPLLSLWWVDRLGGAPAACTQMLQPGSAVTLMLAGDAPGEAE